MVKILIEKIYKRKIIVLIVEKKYLVMLQDVKNVILILLYFIPLILYAKGAYKADSIFIYIFLISLFYFIILENARGIKDEENKSGVCL